jgi:hypothetical protein
MQCTVRSNTHIFLSNGQRSGRKGRSKNRLQPQTRPMLESTHLLQGQQKPAAACTAAATNFVYDSLQIAKGCRT